MKISSQAGCQWLMPVILATQEAAFRRINRRSQPQANSLLLGKKKKTILKKLLEWLKW
jgi:hypothetical protein